MAYVEHPFQAVFDTHSSILILGTIPSPQSRIHGFYYSHPQNAFWRVLATLLQENIPQTPTEKRKFLLQHHIALWDVLQACDIEGASDSHIRNPVPNDFSVIFETAPIQKIFTTGKKATSLYRKFCEPRIGLPTTYLPSTSPANRYWYPFEKLVEAYKTILPLLK